MQRRFKLEIHLSNGGVHEILYSGKEARLSYLQEDYEAAKKISGIVSARILIGLLPRLDVWDEISRWARAVPAGRDELGRIFLATPVNETTGQILVDLDEILAFTREQRW